MRASSQQIIQIACGRDHLVVLLSSGKALAWGGIGSGRSLDGSPDICSTPISQNRPIEINTSHKLKSIAAGFGVNLGLTEHDKVVSWGNSSIGIGGNNQIIAVLEPELLDLPEAKVIAAGEHNFAIVDLQGHVHTWGMNVDGVLGRPTAHLNALPGMLQDLPSIKSIAMGQGSVFAISNENDLYAWGSNSAGQLGLGHLDTQLRPAPIKTPMKIASVVAGATHVLALSTDGNVLVWGSNNKGQLGSNTQPYSSTPITLNLPEEILAIAAGLHFSLAVSKTGNLYAWGWNGYGQLGLSDFVDRTQPTKVANLSKVQSISANHTFAVASTTSKLWGWGNNGSGQIGNTNLKVNHPSSFLSIA